MKSILLLSLLALSVSAIPMMEDNNKNSLFVKTPHGLVPKECHHELPFHSKIEEIDGVLHVFDSETNSLFKTIPKCNVSSSIFGAKQTLPADYDGWEAYTAVKSDKGFDSFLGYFSVPDTPAERPDILYIFTGLQNIDWIPKVDPEPSTQFDIIQPVLQYPGDGGDYWSVKSWYVVLDFGTMSSRERRVQPGDAIFGNMTRVGSSSWLVSSTVVSSGESTSITPNKKRLASQPWAYNTLECYGCNSCATYPKQDSIFYNLTLVETGGNVLTPTWLANPKPSQDRKCNEGVKIVDPRTVNVFFNGEKEM